MEIEIPFNNWSKERLHNKTKFATSRNKRYGKAGDTFKVSFRYVDYEYEILAVFKLKLYYVATCLYYIEGAEHPIEFRKVWEALHPKAGWEPEKEVYVHIFIGNK